MGALRGCGGGDPRSHALIGQDIDAAFDAVESKFASDFGGRALEELRYDARVEPMHLDEILEDCAPRMARNTDWSADECASLLGSVLPTLRRWRKDY